MPYVQRNSQGVVIGRFGALQEGYADEWLDDGNPDLLPPFSQIRSEMLDKVRSARVPVLNALTGIAGRKQRGNKHAMAEAIDTAVQGLLDLPNKPSVTSATTIPALSVALETEYATVVATLAAALGNDWPEVQAAFREYEL